MRVRHGVTTMFSDVNQREISVVRAKDFVIKSLREVLDRTVIGMLMEPDVDFLVQAAATNVLDRMKASYIIADYQTPRYSRTSTTRLGSGCALATSRTIRSTRSPSSSVSLR